MTALLEVLTDIVTATVTAGGTDAPTAGTSETLTVTTDESWPIVISGETQMRVMDEADLGLTSNYEEMILTANANGSLVTWDVTRGSNGFTKVHVANWKIVPVVTPSGLDGRYLLKGGPPFFNIMDPIYGAVGDGITDDSAAIQAAEDDADTHGGIVWFPPAPGGSFAIVSRITKSGRTRWVGCGPGITGSSPGTKLLCTASGAGVDVITGYGGGMESIVIDGGTLATQPLRDGTSPTVFPEDHRWDSVWVENGAQDNWVILGSQNSVYVNCRSDGAVRDALVMDGGTGGHEFFGFKCSNAGRYWINAPWAHPGGPYGAYIGSINFWGGICDNGVPGVGVLNLTNARDVNFRGMTFYGVPATGPAISIDTTTVFNADFSGSLIYAHAGQPCMALNSGSGSGASCAVNVTGVEFVSGGNSIAIASPTAALQIIGWESIVADFTTGKASYAGGPIDPEMILRGKVGYGQSTGNGTTVLGSLAGAQINTSAAGNTALGFRALESAQTGSSNTATGSQCGLSVTGSNNTLYGALCAASLTSGTLNAIFGGAGGTGLTTGSKNTAIGQGTVLGATNSFQTAIGYGTSATLPGSVAIGVDHTGAAATAAAQDDFILGTGLHNVKIPGTLSVAGVPITPGGGSTIAAIPAQNIAPLNLANWRKMVVQADTAAASTKILSIGTSVSQGGGVFPNASTQSPAAYLASLLNSKVCPCQMSGAIPMPYSAGGTAYDNRWTLASGWTLPATNGSQAGIGIGDNGFLIGASGGSGTAKFTPPATETVDTFDVWYYGASNTGIFKINVDGGTDTTITTTNATAGYYKATITTTRATGHVLNMHAVTTNGVYVVLVEGYDSTVKELHVVSGSIDSIGTSTFYAAAASVAAIEAYAPNLTIIELGADDALAYPSNPSTSTFMTNFAAIVAACKTSGDVIVWNSMQVDPALALPNIANIIAAFEGYVAAIITYCATNSIAYVDVHSRFGPFSEWGTALGFAYTDNVHPNALGNADIGRALFAGLKAVV
jgi:lysophospholipase L1-like esterase